MATPTYSDDKLDIETVEQSHHGIISDTKLEDGDFQRHLDPVLDRQTLWRLDVLLVPLVCAMYLLAFLDRANIGNARVAGLQKDLAMSDTQYQTGELALLCFAMVKRVWIDD
jgi:hypothetical protein